MDQLLEIELETPRRRWLVGKRGQGRFHVVDLYRAKDTSAWVVVPLCRNAGINLDHWDIVEIDQANIQHMLPCVICQAAIRMTPAPITLSGEEQYMRVAEYRKQQQASARLRPETRERASGTLGTATDGEAWSVSAGVWSIGSGEKAQGEE